MIDKKPTERNSSIELLKIGSILLVIICHVCGTIANRYEVSVPYDYYIDIYHSSTDIPTLIIGFLRYGGYLADSIFIACTSWFLCDANKLNPRKIVNILSDTWVISMLILLISLFTIGAKKLGGVLIVRSMFPNILCNNWFISIYIILYLVHTGLNIILHNIRRSTLVRISFCLVTIYFCVGTLIPGILFYSRIIYCITIYLVVGIIRIHFNGFAGYRTQLKRVCLICAMFLVFQYIAINEIGLKYGFIGRLNARLITETNPLLLGLAIGIVLLCAQRTCHSKAINWLASMTILVYLTHENLIIRTIVRPAVFNLIYNGNRILLLVTGTTLTALFSLTVSFFYKMLLQTRVHRLAIGLYMKILNHWKNEFCIRSKEE